MENNIALRLPRKPVAAYTHYAGLPITPYGFQLFTQRHIDLILNNIRVCKHGSSCRKCCFSFALEVSHSAHKNEFGITRPRSPQGNFRESVISFVYKLVFGKVMCRSLNLSCKNERCCNVLHAVVPHSHTYYYMMAKIWKCEHGDACNECCWSWLGATCVSSGKTCIRLEVPGHKLNATSLQRLLVEEIFNIREHKPRERHPKNICNDAMCGNWNHIIIGAESASYHKAVNRKNKQP